MPVSVPVPVPHQIGNTPFHPVTQAQAIALILERAKSGLGGYVATPNVDHVVKAERDVEFAAAYRGAFLSLVDGRALQWAVNALRMTIPEKVSGSDLVEPLCRAAGAAGLRLFVLGGAPGAAEKAAERMRTEWGCQVVGTAAPMFQRDQLEVDWLKAVAEASPQLVLVCFGAPKQEIFMARFSESLAPAVCVGLGASVDFVAGISKRSPQWVSAVGLEWAHRLLREPRRLWRRYLVDDPAFLLIFYREMRKRRRG